MAMSRDQRVARAINARKAKPIPPPRPTSAALNIETADTPCPATHPHDDGGLYVCTRSAHIDGMHFDEERSCHWLPDQPTT